MDEQTSQVDWKEKCQELEKIIKTLSTHCMKVVEKHEELLTKCKKTEEQYDHLMKVVAERGEQIKKAKDVLGPVSMEYKALREKYEIAVACQYEAENYATKMNKAYKRQSQMILNKVDIVDINIDDEEGVDTVQNDYIEKLNDQIQELENEKSILSVQLEELTKEYDLEFRKNGHLKQEVEIYKVELQQARSKLKKQEHTLKLLAQTSEAAYQEYEQLQKQFEVEVTNRMAAEKVATIFHAEQEGAKRQSRMLMENIQGDTKLMKAAIDVEELTTKIETQKSDYELKIKLLEEEIASMKSDTYVVSSEVEKAELETEKTSLQQRLLDAEKTADDMRKQYDGLLKKYADLEQKYQISITPVIPPAPPPPPPPVVKIGGFFPKFGGKKKKKEIERKLVTGGAAVTDGYSKAVDEMMKRIKEGNTGLRPVLKKRTQSVPDDETDSAMNELQGILTKMKKARSEDDLSALDSNTLDEDSELCQVFKKIKQDKPDRPRPRPRKLSTISDKPEEEEEAD